MVLRYHVKDEFQSPFQAGSLVLAKVQGHSDPPWPAEVTEVQSTVAKVRHPKYSRMIEVLKEKYRYVRKCVSNRTFAFVR